METNTKSAAASSPEPSAPSDPAETPIVQQCIAYLQTKDDTSRFVGLALLSSILKNVTDRRTLGKLWDAVSPKFMDRLLKSGKTSLKDNRGPNDRQYTNEC